MKRPVLTLDGWLIVPAGLALGALGCLWIWEQVA